MTGKDIGFAWLEGISRCEVILMETQAKKHFHCKDVGYECEWQLEGESEEQMLPIIEQHAAEVHNLTYFKEQAVEHVLEAIRKNG